MNYLHSDITDKVIKAFYTVYNQPGYGFLEKVYENAMYIESQKFGLIVSNQQSIKVQYYNQIVGNYFADIEVNDVVIVELKTAETFVNNTE